MAFEDAVVLGRLFSHLKRDDQIALFLCAYEELRQKRCSQVASDEIAQLVYSTLPPGEHQEARDADLKSKERAGRNVLEPPDDDDDETTAEYWEKAKFLFDYDAEDVADDWWVQWGLLNERAKGVELRLPPLKVTTIQSIIYHFVLTWHKVDSEQDNPLLLTRFR
jgi:salicylate hydroxylase